MRDLIRTTTTTLLLQSLKLWQCKQPWCCKVVVRNMSGLLLLGTIVLLYSCNEMNKWFSNFKILHPVSCQVSTVLNMSYSFAQYSFWIVFLFVCFFLLPSELLRAFKTTCLVQIYVFDKTVFCKLYFENIERQKMSPQITSQKSVDQFIALNRLIFLSVFNVFLLCSDSSPTCSCRMLFQIVSFNSSLHRIIMIENNSETTYIPCSLKFCVCIPIYN